VRSNILDTSTKLSNHYSVLGRHRLQKAANSDATRQPAVNSFPGLGIPQFLRRMSAGNLNK